MRRSCGYLGNYLQIALDFCENYDMIVTAKKFFRYGKNF